VSSEALLGGRSRDSKLSADVFPGRPFFALLGHDCSHLFGGLFDGLRQGVQLVQAVGVVRAVHPVGLCLQCRCLGHGSIV